MAQTIIYYIATSKKKEIRMGASVTFQWGNYGAWTNFKTPVAVSKKKVKYNKSTKNTPNTTNGVYGGAGGVTVLGTSIPATAERTISGVTRTCAVRYYRRGYVIYSRPSNLKSQKKMYKTTYTNAHPYQYRLRYQDKPILNEAYTAYEDGMEYVFFADKYYKNGVEYTTNGHIPHPKTCNITYTDCRKNFESSANNSDGRDNTGSYILSNVRANIVTLTLEWNGLSASEGTDLLNTLNPELNSKGQYPYLIVQFLDPQTNKAVNKTFFADSRSTERYSNGMFKSISVTLTEV